MRKKIVAGNWKMNTNATDAAQLAADVVAQSNSKNITDVITVVCPPMVNIQSVSEKVNGSNVQLGAQNCHYEQIKSAYTGSISIKMIKKLGAKYVIVGHSEVRATGETDLLINKKIKALVDNKVKIIFCIGETLSQRKKNHTYRILIEYGDSII